MKNLHIPKINTKRGFSISFNKNLDYGNMPEYLKFYYKNELFELYLDGWDLATIYKNQEKNKVIEIFPKFINNHRKFKNVVFYDFS